MEMLVETWVSLANGMCPLHVLKMRADHTHGSATQRKGRAGRVQKGHVPPLAARAFTEQFTLSVQVLLPSVHEPAVRRVCEAAGADAWHPGAFSS
jgi:hypothetical protein